MGRQNCRIALWVLLLISLLVLSMVGDCDAAKKKTKKKIKTKTESVAAKSEETADSGDDSNKEEGQKDEAAKPKKKWNQFTKSDWERMEREAEGPGEPWKPPEPPNIEFDPTNPMAYVKASKKGKPAMMFASLTKIKDKKTGEMRERTKEESEEVAFKHKNLMQSGHLDATPYVIEPGKILWTVHDGSRGYEVKSFLMRQDDIDDFEWDQQKTTKSNFKPKDDPEEEL